MTKEDYALLKQLFNWIPPKKNNRIKNKLEQNWDGKTEQNMDCQPYDGKDESSYPFNPPWMMLDHKDIERWTRY